MFKSKNQRSASSASNPQIRILLATGIYPPEIGGPATYAALLKKELPKRGVDVTVLPFRIVRDWPVGIRHFLYFMKALRWCFTHNLVFAQDTISVGLPSLFAAKLSGRRFIIRVPGDYVWEQSVQRFGVKDSIDDFQHPNSAPSPSGSGNTKAPTRMKRYPLRVEFLRSVQRFVVDHADLVITPSNYFRDLVRGWVKDKTKVITIYNGIELRYDADLRINADAADGGYYRNQQSASSAYNPQHQHHKIIVSAGRLVPWKGFDMVIEMMRDLPEWKLIIAGDGPEYQNLQLLITNYQLQDRVKLLGQISREELMQKLRESEVFVLNTHFESFSFQIVEAMSLGLPVVATKIGNLDEIIDDGANGFLVEPDNKDQFLDAIRRLDLDADLRQMISQNAAAKARNFSIENTVNNLQKVISQLVL